MAEEQPAVIKAHAVAKRCPKCYTLSLRYDSQSGRLFCTKCDFESNVKKTI